MFCRRCAEINWQLVSNRKCTIKLQWPEGARCHRRPMTSAEVGLSSGSRRRPIKPMRSRTRSDSGRRETRFFPFSSSLLFSSHPINTLPLQSRLSGSVHDARRQKLLCCSPVLAVGPHGPQLCHLCVAGTRPPPACPLVHPSRIRLLEDHQLTSFFANFSCAVTLLPPTMLSPSSRARRALMYVSCPAIAIFFLTVPAPTAP